MANPAISFSDHLHGPFGSSHVIERELGGGGMSRVFLAHDTELERSVVIKLLPSGFAGLDAERFHREILLSAQLQHPHIVPVLQAGRADALLYYTMPYVEGESLRARLSRDEPLPIEEVVSILADVSDALAYAHERGVVHRDIKPENILLNRGHALVTDFGVAKALSDAERALADDDVDTGAGVVVGTPAYMSPEQASGDPSVDHRTDLYALGIVAYELLAGVPPFSSRSTRELLGAHAARLPAPIGDRRDGIPPALASLVMRCLEKHPANRPQSAAEIRSQLRVVSTPSAAAHAPVHSMRSARAYLAVLAMVMLVVLAGVAALSLRAHPVPIDDNVVAVVPFHVTGADPSLRYLREGMLDLLAAKLTGEGGPRSADPRRVLQAIQREAGSDTADLSRAQTLALAQNLGAGRVLLGEISGSPRRVVLDGSLITVRDGRAQAQARVEGPADSLSRLVDQLTAKLLAIGAGEAERATSLSSTPLPALRAFLDGQTLYRRARYRDAATEFGRALQLDSTFALAALGMATASGWFGDPDQQWQGMQAAWSHRDRLSRRDRALLDAIAGPRFPAPSSAAELLAAARCYLGLAPERAEAWFQYGDWMMHFGPALGSGASPDSAAAVFRQALAIDSSFAPAIEHLVLLDARAGDTASVRNLVASYTNVDPAGENVDGIRWRAAVALRDTAALRQLRGRVPALTPVSAHTIQLISQLDGVDLGLADAVAASEVAHASSATNKLVPFLVAHDLAMNEGHIGRAAEFTNRLPAVQPQSRVALRERVRDALFWDGDTLAAAAAARELRRLLLQPRPTEPYARAMYFTDLCTLGIWNLSHRDTRQARREIDILRSDARASDVATGSADFNVHCAMLLEAMLASVDRRADAAATTQRLDSLMRTGPGGSIQQIGNLVVARLDEEIGDPHAALAALRRRDFLLFRPAFLSTYLREEGRLAALTGDRDGAIAAYRHYLVLRQNPDPALRGESDRVRAELEVLLRPWEHRGAAAADRLPIGRK